MATAKCSQCVALAVPEDEMGPVVDECAVCGDWSCEWHGHEYRAGFEHESCHETPDFSRIEE